MALAIATMSSHSAHAASVAPASTGSVFGGFTSQRLPSFFQLSKNGKMLVVGSVAIAVRCTSGATPVLEDDFMHRPIAANGSFQGSWAVPAVKQSDGTTFSASGSVKGHLDSRHQKLTGTWHLHLTLVSTTGQSDECDSGLVRFADRQ